MKNCTYIYKFVCIYLFFKANPSYLRPYQKRRFLDGFEISALGLQFTVTQDHIDKPSASRKRNKQSSHNQIRLKCTAITTKVINMSSKEEIISQPEGLMLTDASYRIVQS